MTEERTYDAAGMTDVLTGSDAVRPNMGQELAAQPGNCAA
jgi:hypothetical protein